MDTKTPPPQQQQHSQHKQQQAAALASLPSSTELILSSQALGELSIVQLLARSSCSPRLVLISVSGVRVPEGRGRKRQREESFDDEPRGTRICLSTPQWISITG